MSGGNGGYQAVHIAAQRGARRILLCGFDMREVGGKKHWFGDHPEKLNSKQTYRNWINNFASLAPVLRDMGVDVVNCTPGSALTGFRKAKLGDALNA